ncbi:hypothetical protein ENUP19_0047G0244 [Entamoeba nuttalli]|uniref:Guanine deaminase n=2 Tax=Entamoeba nuttalli TaxID=412467 RepID=K2G4S3_ENTNP|nr:guanine deaminase [Entamoeba nuttalli P19]EKE37311.1 guanine deaminase [Entamoeba nuttalli P19]|eukprot:XP_008860355.1 guanine deaminase [Entamoeba nuttalli P19]
MSETKQVKVFKGLIIDTPTSNQIRFRDSFIGVENGSIIFIENTLPKQYSENDVIVLKSGEFLFPGLIDCHLHAPQYAFIGTAFGKPLLEWLEATVHKFEPKCADKNYAEKLYNQVVRKTLQNGTTTASYFGTIHTDSDIILANICEKRHQRAFIGKVNQDQMFPDNLKESTDKSIQETIRFIESFKGYHFVKPIITPRFAVSCTRDLMKKLGQLAQERDVFLQTHLSESPGECDLIKSMYPECKNYTDVYEQYECLTDKTLLAHSIHLSDEEMDVIKKHESSLIHCPNANLTMKSGFCPVKKALGKGIKMGMGTDISGGFSASILDSMRLGLIVGNINDIVNKTEPVSLSEIIYLATNGGAHCLNMQDQIGSFEVGKKFDALRVDLNANDSPIDLFEWNSNEQMVERFILQGDSRVIKEVYVEGSLVDTSI